MKKIVTILGARPQFVKAAVLSRIIVQHNHFEEIIVHTGQHFDDDMSTVFFDEMNIPKPKYNLSIHSLGHAAMTGQMLDKIEPILLEEKPDAVVVYGDTNSTLAGALAAKKLHIKLIHIEAGLRSFNMEMPEEVNRVITDRIADLLSCPTDAAVQNLIAEGFEKLPIKIENHGDIMRDSVGYYSAMANRKSRIMTNLNLTDNSFVLATIHRQENTDDKERLISIFAALEQIHKEKQVVLPLHPRTKNLIDKYQLHPKITLVSPLGYFDMLVLLKNCNCVITDSGGLQKEAFFNKKPCIIARDETEWTELVANGFATITGSNQQQIYAAYTSYKTAKLDFSIDLYGDNAGEKIYQSIIQLINN